MAKRRRPGLRFDTDARCYKHAPLVNLSDAAFRLYGHGNAWCVDNGRDGDIPQRALRQFVQDSIADDPWPSVRELELFGRWETTDAGWVVTDWPLLQSTAAERAAANEANAARQRKYLANMTPEERAAYRAKDALRNSRSRAVKKRDASVTLSVTESVTESVTVSAPSKDESVTLSVTRYGESSQVDAEDGPSASVTSVTASVGKRSLTGTHTRTLTREDRDVVDLFDPAVVEQARAAARAAGARKP